MLAVHYCVYHVNRAANLWLTTSMRSNIIGYDKNWGLHVLNQDRVYTVYMYANKTWYTHVVVWSMLYAICFNKIFRLQQALALRFRHC